MQPSGQLLRRQSWQWQQSRPKCRCVDVRCRVCGRVDVGCVGVGCVDLGCRMCGCGV